MGLATVLLPHPLHFNFFFAKPSPIAFSFSPNRTISTRRTSSSTISASESSSSSWEREEIRWLREEQRWIREEQRWLREESRWNTERGALLHHIELLQARINALEHDRPLPDGEEGKFSGFDVVLHSPERSSRSPPALVEKADVKEIVFEENRVSKGVEEVKKARRTLRTGSEGEDVRAMQEALERLGFYSGEEDIEFSTFSSGTERAVKTWQASLNIREDGIMTTELLEKLFVEPTGWDSRLGAKSDQSDDKPPEVERVSTNGAPVAPVTKMADIQGTVIKDDSNEHIEEYQHKVFLLGENRWEEPSRLVGMGNHSGGSRPASSMKCNTCHGEGHQMCTECDGTGEPNVEPQFLEWIGEDTKCPYCEGLGYTICDACKGKALVEN